ncbi:MAG TPA: N-formylglutamate amidohydrolase [Thermohalobaculum sp.]|nr:N-formylglutamate amidohydrolase [Thermohalobaculum sp.]
MSNPPFLLLRPPGPATNVIFSSPHSGRDYPEALVRRSRLTRRQLRASEDVLVDRLFAAAPAHGAPLLAATAPRAWLDLNRAPDELDPALIEGVQARGLNQRVAAGLGVVPRVVAEGAEIYSGKIAREEAEERIRDVHVPFHAALEGLIEEARARFGTAVLYDCHSMPSEALRAAPRVRGRSPDIVLGDRFGATASRALVARTQEAFVAAGLTVTRNAPFAGGYVTQRYGRPARGVSAIQIEIDRGLYLDRKRLEPNEDFPELCRLIGQVVADLVRPLAEEPPLAAE